MLLIFHWWSQRAELKVKGRDVFPLFSEISCEVTWQRPGIWGVLWRIEALNYCKWWMLGGWNRGWEFVTFFFLAENKVHAILALLHIFEKICCPQFLYLWAGINDICYYWIIVKSKEEALIKHSYVVYFELILGPFPPFQGNLGVYIPKNQKDHYKAKGK